MNTLMSKLSEIEKDTEKLDEMLEDTIEDCTVCGSECSCDEFDDDVYYDNK